MIREDARFVPVLTPRESMVVLDASRRNQPVPRLAACSLGAGVVATFELLMMLIRTGRGIQAGEAETGLRYQPVPPLAHEAAPELTAAPTMEQTIRARHEAGHSQRAIARELNIDRRKVKRILEQAA